jgi:hypothetical protein
MTELNTDTIAGRIKRRTLDNARIGRVGGTEHKKKVEKEKKIWIKEKNGKRKNSSADYQRKNNLISK